MSIEPHNTISVELPNDAATETKQDAGNTLLDAISDTLIAEAEAAPRTAFGEQSHAPPDWPAGRIEIHVARLSATTTGGASGSYLDVVVYLNASGSLLTQAVTSWYDETANGVIAWQDSTTTAAFAPSGKIIRQAQLNNGERITLDDLNLDLSPGQSVTIAVTPSANNMRTRVTLSGHEIH